MESFSERLGYTSPKKILQIEEIDDALRNGLWDCVTASFLNDVIFMRNGYPRYTDSFSSFSRNLWFGYFKQPRDTIPDYPQDCINVIREFFFDKEFPEFFNFIEFLASSNLTARESEKFQSRCNFVLEREKSVLRFISGSLTPISDAVELKELRTTLSEGTPEQVRLHISKAIDFYSDRENPDYRNSIKEAILAVEAAAKIVTEDNSATLGKALNSIDKTHHLDPALKLGLSKIYGWTSGDNGIRHAMMEYKEIREPDARFMLVSCSAFANYLLSLIAK